MAIERMTSVEVVVREQAGAIATGLVPEIIEGFLDYSVRWNVQKAACSGYVSILKRLGERKAEISDHGLDWSMRIAATEGYLGVVQWLTEYKRNVKISTRVMDAAAFRGNLEIVQWLHENRSEGLQWLWANRAEGCTTVAVDFAIYNGHFPVVKWFSEQADFQPRAAKHATGSSNRGSNALIKKEANGQAMLTFDAGNHHRQSVDVALHNSTTKIAAPAMDEPSTKRQRVSKDDASPLRASPLSQLEQTEIASLFGVDVALRAAVERDDAQSLEFLYNDAMPDSTQDLDMIQWWEAPVRLLPLPFSVVWRTLALNLMARAARKGSLKVVQWLHVNRKGACSNVALVCAAEEGQLVVARWLVSHGVKDATLEAARAAERKGHKAVAWWLRLFGQTDTARNAVPSLTRVRVIVREHAGLAGCAPALELLEAFLDLAARCTLTMAVRSGSRSLIRSRLWRDSLFPIFDFEWAMQLAAERGDVSTLELLYAFAKRKQRPLPVCGAKVKRNFDKTRRWFAGISHDVGHWDALVAKLLVLAAKSGQLATVRWILPHINSAMAHEAVKGAAHRGHLDVVRCLCCNANAVDNDNLLVLAAEAADTIDHLSIVQFAFEQLTDHRELAQHIRATSYSMLAASQ
ncbi:hypothetical protein BBJ28_00004666 [Nothophytophthora sp. Chile5]|nr:hypothetical protein BBJ28_00004666 [Nothophytophthora sp. Chile5]